MPVARTRGGGADDDNNVALSIDVAAGDKITRAHILTYILGRHDDLMK